MAQNAESAAQIIAAAELAAAVAADVEESADGKLLEQRSSFAEGRSCAAETENGIFFADWAKRADFRIGLRKADACAGRVEIII